MGHGKTLLCGTIGTGNRWEEGRCEMESSAEIAFKDSVSSALRTLAGVSQALWQVREESTDCEMCHMLADVVDRAARSVRDAMPEDWGREAAMR